jgi:hypothetical protein
MGPSGAGKVSAVLIARSLVRTGRRPVMYPSYYHTALYNAALYVSYYSNSDFAIFIILPKLDYFD